MVPAGAALARLRGRGAGDRCRPVRVSRAPARPGPGRRWRFVDRAARPLVRGGRHRRRCGGRRAGAGAHEFPDAGRRAPRRRRLCPRPARARTVRIAMTDLLQEAERPATRRREELLPRIREFARQELVPQQAHFDSLPDVPVAACGALHESGLGNWWLPERYGGLGLGLEDSVDVVSELAYGDAGVAFTMFISILGTVGLLLYGSEEVRERYLAPMPESGHFCATLASERAAGSELTKI